MAAPSKGKHIRRDCSICSSIVVIPPVMMMRMMIKFVKNKKQCHMSVVWFIKIW